jgi:ethanolamine utilization protein EutA (predicted chaperonin)
LLLSPNTSLTYGENSFDMGCGEVLVTTVVKRMTARVANLTVTPNSDVAKYQIVRASGKLEIATREGSISVSDGVQTTSLDSGKQISFSAGNDCPLAATAADQSSTASSKPVSISKGKIAAIVLGAAGAGGAGIALALSKGGAGRPPASPSQP